MNFYPRLLSHWPIYLIAALIVLLSLVTLVGERGALHLWRLRGEKHRLDEQNYRLQKENESLRQRVHRIGQDDDYLEKLAREELNMVRPGDIVYRFQTGQGSRQVTGREANEALSRQPPAKAQKERRIDPR
jgi:cell division protein FtsB